MKPGWPIETDRLAALHELYGDENVARFLYSGPETIEDARARLARYLERVELTETSGLSAAVTLPDTTYVGGLALRHTDFEQRQAEIAYVVLPRHQGQGYAGEAARARLEMRNAASARVAEKLGMRREPLPLENELVYAIPEGEWQR